MGSSAFVRFMSGLLALGITLAATLVAGCDDPNYAEPPFYTYSIQVGGLEHFYTDAGPAFVGFPAPGYDGSAFLPFHDLITPENPANVTRGNRNSTGLVGVDPANRDARFHGTRGAQAVNIGNHSMVVFEAAPTGDYNITLWGASTLPPGLTIAEEYIDGIPGADTTVTYYKIQKPSVALDPLTARLECTIGPDGSSVRRLIDSLATKPFFEASGASASPYTRWVTDANVSHYTTYIYIDPGLKPEGSGNYSLDIVAHFSVTVGYRIWGRGPDEHYVCAISESIPGNVTGFVPVTVQCFGNLSNSDSNRLFGTYF